MLSDAYLPELPAHLRKAKRKAEGGKRRKKRRFEPPQRTIVQEEEEEDGKKEEEEEGQISHQLDHIKRSYNPIVHPDDYVIPFKQLSTRKELIEKNIRSIEMVNRLYRCVHCGFAYSNLTNFTRYACLMHPGILRFDSREGISRYTCCKLPSTDAGLGCLPCIHSRNAKSRDKIIHTQDKLMLDEELVNAALESGGAFYAGETTDAMHFLAFMSRKTSEPYDIPDHLIFAVDKEMLTVNTQGYYFIPTKLLTFKHPTVVTRPSRSILP